MVYDRNILIKNYERLLAKIKVYNPEIQTSFYTKKHHTYTVSIHTAKSRTQRESGHVAETNVQTAFPLSQQL